MYITIKNALLANGYDYQSTMRLASKFAKRADPIAALNSYLAT
jgi:hypothetical protein